MKKEDPVSESSETITLAGPETPAAPELSAPTVEWKFLIKPIGTLIFGATLALGHHAFNTWEDGRSVENNIVPQHWVTRIGIAFSFGFKSALTVAMGFVLLQCLWFSVIHQPLTIQQIDTMYRIERQDQLYKTLPKAIFYSPTIVVFSALTLLLPLSGLFAPGSLTISNPGLCKVPIGEEIIAPCMIPTGNLSTPNTIDSTSLFTTSDEGVWTGITPRATVLIERCLLQSDILGLPQPCGPDCRYEVDIPSFVFQCTPNPSSLPHGQAGEIWNGTMNPNSKWGFYIAWQSNGPNGTSGNASCSPFQAQYHIEVQTTRGFQSVTTNLTKNASSIPDITNLTVIHNISADMLNLLMPLASISHATQAFFLGNITSSTSSFVGHTHSSIPPSFINFQPSFGFLAEIDGTEIVWGDVLNGIEEISHNVAAGLLTLQLGNMSSQCYFDHQDVVYQYSSFALWAPYGTALGIALISLVVSIMIMARNHTGHITTSFSDTAILMRNLDEDISAGAKLKLRAVKGGKLEYTVE